MWETSGGLALMREAGLLAAVHGHSDYLLRADRVLDGGPDALEGDAAIERAAEMMDVQVVSAARGIAVLDPRDVRRLGALVIRSVVRGSCKRQDG